MTTPYDLHHTLHEKSIADMFHPRRERVQDATR